MIVWCDGYMDANFINLTTENIATEHLCCIIRSKKPHPGVEAKRRWISERLKEGHVFRKVKQKEDMHGMTKGMFCYYINMSGTENK